MANYLEYLTANENIAYPFIDGTTLAYTDEDISYTNPTVVPASLLVDAFFLIDFSKYTVNDIPTKVLLTKIAKPAIATSNYLTLTFNAIGDVSININLPEGNKLHKIDSTYIKGFILLSDKGLTFLSELYGQMALSSFITTSLEFSPCVIESTLSRVESLQIVYSAKEKILFNHPEPFTIFDEFVCLKAGYNTLLELTASSSDEEEIAFNSLEEPYRSITISANEGEGEGRYNPCGDPKESDASLKSINNVAADSIGRFYISHDDCFNIKNDISNNLIVVNSSCTVCCDCEDYVKLLLKEKYYIYALDSRRRGSLAELISSYNTDTTAWNRIIAERKKEVRLNAWASVGSSSLNSQVRAPSRVTINIRVEHQALDLKDNNGNIANIDYVWTWINPAFTVVDTFYVVPIIGTITDTGVKEITDVVNKPYWNGPLVHNTKVHRISTISKYTTTTTAEPLKVTTTNFPEQVVTTTNFSEQVTTTGAPISWKGLTVGIAYTNIVDRPIFTINNINYSFSGVITNGYEFISGSNILYCVLRDNSIYWKLYGSNDEDIVAYTDNYTGDRILAPWECDIIYIPVVPYKQIPITITT